LLSFSEKRFFSHEFPEGTIQYPCAQRHALQPPRASAASEACRVNAHVGRHGKDLLIFLLEEPLILVMRTNPKPRYCVTFQQSKRSVSQTNALSKLAGFLSLV
jgi:hypothetical protein